MENKRFESTSLTCLAQSLPQLCCTFTQKVLDIKTPSRLWLITTLSFIMSWQFAYYIILNWTLRHLFAIWSTTWLSSAAAAAKSLQSCPTLRDPMDCSPPGSSIHGIFQARVLEWGATAFSVIIIYGLLKRRDVWRN